MSITKSDFTNNITHGNMYNMNTNFLKKYRDAAKLTQEKLAELSGVKQNHISMIERGEREIVRKNAIKLSKVLGCTPEDLYEGESSPYPVKSSHVGVMREHVPVSVQPSALEYDCAREYVADAIAEYPQATKRITSTVEKQIAEMLMRDNRSGAIYKRKTYVDVAGVLLSELCGNIEVKQCAGDKADQPDETSPTVG